MRILILLGAALAACESAPPTSSEKQTWPTITVKATDDFEITGNGTNAAWAKTEWVALHRRPKGDLPYESRFKILYSKTGLYVLMDGTDAKLTTTGRADFENLWEEDVYEAFFWPDESQPLYFEYEISQKNHELPILVPNNGGAFMGWRPWHYEGDRKIRKQTSVRLAAEGRRDDAVEGWSAEFFIPYKLLNGLKNVPPKSGSKWRANFYRMDYDDKKTTQWDWSRVGPSFHEYQKYGVIVFE
jgi:hypothetical protein